jgi:Protein of unknown function (DUF3662)/FHA domain
MGLLDNLEQRLDRIVNGSFSKAFKSVVQPVELGAGLQQEIDNRASTLSGQNVVPNIFLIELGSVDHDRLMPYFSTLSSELAVLADSYISEQRYTTLGRAVISFALDSQLETGVFRIKSSSGQVATSDVAPPVNPDITSQIPMQVFSQSVSPYFTTISGEVFRVSNSISTIGRGVEADIKIDDASISRLHCEVILGSEVLIRDLGSTNGTLVDGQRITEATLQENSIVKIGNITMTYKSR